MTSSRPAPIKRKEASPARKLLCQYCGVRQSAENNRCEACGAPLPEAGRKNALEDAAWKLHARIVSPEEARYMILRPGDIILTAEQRAAIQLGDLPEVHYSASTSPSGNPNSWSISLSPSVSPSMSVSPSASPSPAPEDDGITQEEWERQVKLWRDHGVLPSMTSKTAPYAESWLERQKRKLGL